MQEFHIGDNDDGYRHDSKYRSGSEQVSFNFFAFIYNKFTLNSLKKITNTSVCSTKKLGQNTVQIKKKIDSKKTNTCIFLATSIKQVFRKRSLEISNNFFWIILPDNDISL